MSLKFEFSEEELVVLHDALRSHMRLLEITPISRDKSAASVHKNFIQEQEEKTRAILAKILTVGIGF